MSIDISNFKPYIWPNPSFPFRIYYEDNLCRIFIIENLQHNWQWMLKYREKFRSGDFFFVIIGWHYSDWLTKQANIMFDILSLNKENFFILYNSQADKDIFSSYGFNGDIINQNAWLDETLVMKPIKLQKEFDAIYVARKVAFKRHFLASKIPNLALVVGNSHGNIEVDLPPSKYLNSALLTPEQVCEKINQSFCGLILSEYEGACFASSEYLLCGIPVVSTPSFGGRDVWYNEYNSIIAEPTPDAVASAVEEMVKYQRNPEMIRNMHIKQSFGYREKFIDILDKTLKMFGVKDIDTKQYFYKNFFHKMRKSYKPDFESIF
jgi:glycosyltransferase involved in cell wall biosynthesis